MHDFDVARKEREAQERTLTLGGETFTYRAGVAPEVLTRWEDAQVQGLSATGTVAMMDEVILTMLEPGQEKKWAKIRSPELTHPVTLADLSEVVKFLIRENAGRPTESPSGSSLSGGDTTTPSTGASLSLAGEA